MRPAVEVPALLTGASWLEVVRPHLSTVLVDRRAQSRLDAVARYLPGDGIYVLETGLGPGGEAADLSLGLAAPARARPLLGHPGFGPPHLRSFLGRWLEGADELRPVRALWLEFDLDEDPDATQVPVVCAKLRPGCDPSWLALTLLPALHGRPLTAPQERLVRRLAARVPAGGRILYAFSLLGRPGGAVRLELYGLGPAAILDYLDRVAPAELRPQVAAILPLIIGGDRYHLSFDLGAEIAPRIGIEVAFARLPHREPRWGELFDRLVAAGLCTADKRRAVFAWPGWDTRQTAAWPAAAAPGGYCARCLSHVKLVTWPDRPPQAKVYLLYQYLQRGGAMETPPSARG